MKFFVVEDSAPLRRELISQLSALAGATVIGHAATADDAIRGIRETMPDVVTLDLHLRSGTGIDVLDAMQHASHRPTIIVISNHAESSFRARCLATGARYVFDKSTEFDQAIQACRRISGGHSDPSLGAS